MNNIPIALDLKNDLDTFLRNRLKRSNLMKLGIVVSDEDNKRIENEDTDTLITLYSRLRNRLLLGRKRQVIVHKSLLNNKKYKVYKSKILKLKRALENGSSMRPYLSNKVNELYSVDGLLLDWGMHHLHFTSCYSKDKRGNDILFIVEEDEKIHFITILTHADFHNTDLLRYIYENCPEVISGYKLVGVSSPAKALTTSEIRNLRKFDAAYCISFDGNTYAPSLNKNSNTRLIEAKLQLFNILPALEKRIIEQQNFIFKQLDDMGAINITNLSLEWIIDNKSLELQLYDKKHKVMCNFDCQGIPNPIIILRALNII